jgi:Holliday junction resolvase RusA-like endonuclease
MKEKDLTKNIILSIPGNVRSKKNHRIIVLRGNKKVSLPPTAYQKWEKEARQHAFWQLRGKIIPVHSGPVSVKAVFYYKGPKLDLTACMEAIADCLQGIVWENDGQIFSWDGTRMQHDIENPRTIVEIGVYQ